MSARGQVHLWVAQRVTAVILGVAVVVHLATIIAAVRGGLTAAFGIRAAIGLYA